MSKARCVDIAAVVAPFGYQAERATVAAAPMFEQDLGEADKYDMGRTWRQDWKAELYATLQVSGDSFIVTSPLHAGAALFGLSAVGASP